MRRLRSAALPRCAVESESVTMFADF